MCEGTCVPGSTHLCLSLAPWLKNLLPFYSLYFGLTLSFIHSSVAFHHYFTLKYFAMLQGLVCDVFEGHTQIFFILGFYLNFHFASEF